jgi:DNA repair exonuclease SbcCD ATPase subunit
LILISMRVRNFYSIGDMTVDFTEGLHKIVATNYDSSDGSSGSNGSGKSSLMAAVSQALFNRNPKNDNTSTKLNDTCNHVTGKCYEITVEFEVEGNKYTVINSRENGASIKVFENGSNISSKTIKGNLQLISDIIGLNYESFVSLTFLSQATINTLLFSSSPESLLNRFLSLNTITSYEKHLKDTAKSLKKDLAVVTTKSEGLSSTLRVLEEFTPVDTTDLQVERSAHLDELYAIKHSEDAEMLVVLSTKMGSVQTKYDAVKQTYNDLAKECSVYKDLITDMDTSTTCPTCGQPLKDSEKRLDSSVVSKLENAETSKKEARDKLSEIKKEYDTVSGMYNEISDRLYKKENEIQQKINALDNQIVVNDSRRKEYEAAKEKKESIIRDIQSTAIELDDIKNKILFCDTALKVVRSGAIQQEYFRNFVIYMQKEVNALSDKFTFPYKIKVTTSKKDISYSFLKVTTNGLQEVSFHSLSSGEKTRVSLIVLISIINTLQTLTGVKLGFLVFDEFLSVMDADGVKLFTDIVKDISADKAVYVVQHHEEMPNEVFDSVLEIEKRGGVTKFKEGIKK